MLRPSRFALCGILLATSTAACGDDGDGVGDGTTAGTGTSGSTTTSTTGSDTTTGPGGGGPGSGGSGGSGSTSGAGGADACATDVPHVPAAPPARPDAPAGTGARRVLAVSAYFLGDTDRDGTQSPISWTGFGYDVDGLNTVDSTGDDKVTNEDLGCHCSPQQGEPNAANLEDAAAGLDNSFGRNILSFLGAVLEDPSAQATAAVEDGEATMAFDLSALGPEPDASPSPGALLALRGGEDGTWEVAPESIAAGDPAQPLVRFDEAWLAGNTWVSGPRASLDVRLRISGVPLVLSLRNAVVSMVLSPDRASASQGIISGTLDTEAFAVELGSAMGAIVGGDVEGLCPGDPLFESILQNIRNASDILADGSQEAGTTCTGITVGLGFDATLVEIGGVAPVEPPPDDPCL